MKSLCSIASLTSSLGGRLETRCLDREERFLPGAYPRAAAMLPPGALGTPLGVAALAQRGAADLPAGVATAAAAPATTVVAPAASASAAVVAATVADGNVLLQNLRKDLV